MLTSVAITAFAVNSVDISSVEVSGSSFKVNFETSGLDSSDQVTIISYQGESPATEATVDNIMYIDQIDKSSNTDIEFDFDSAPCGTYQVKMGGTDVDSPSLMSITVDSGMEGTKYFDGNPIQLFTDALTVPDKITDENGNLLILRPETRYAAAYAQAPAKDGYTVLEYGIRINGVNKSAKVALTNRNSFGMLFHGSAIAGGKTVVAFPYVTYRKNGSEETITYYGNTVNTIFAR